MLRNASSLAPSPERLDYLCVFIHLKRIFLVNFVEFSYYFYYIFYDFVNNLSFILSNNASSYIISINHIKYKNKANN